MSVRTRREPWLLLLPAIVLLALAFVTPVAGMLLMSVQSSAGGFTLDNFTRLFTSEYHLQAALRSLRLGVIQTVITLIIAIPLSYVMARAGSKVRSFLLIVVILPLMTSVVVRTFGWVVLMGPSGLLMKIPGAEFLVGGTQGFLGTETGVVIAMVQVLLPFAVLSILGVISGIRPQLEEAARTLGAGFWRTLWHVVLPLAIPGIVAGASLVFVLSVSSFITPRFIGGAQIPVFAQTIYIDATTNLDWSFAAAQAVLLFAGVMLVLAATSRLGKQKV
ncbi:ABC transporter permease [Microbacterium oxydans]|jgi:putative spermidine/putrescine transport system permease protein|uniref:Spermidine/putrescine transport system permease protein PotB n=1 Tax=Microbacterium oxydans TaxID=82380 RepID=A0A3S9WQX0_9MICO|nr:MULTISPECIES: ABC transporter permease [Microbacterium]AZS42448.1 Spermidine/putrescine transport system permease protein PotB [Microbacterium oxydans]KAB1892792.1 ABC transporter permease [Microbacterium oxydans]KKX97288.1 ABC transporter permease [Microbacterium sp. Ag1]MBE7955087.1 ABC transporter permease [Microbacterium sp. R1]NYF29784.1 putative spermidine/putrescine transport system permease protein [Microbacterium sp. JAI119]